MMPNGKELFQYVALDLETQLAHQAGACVHLVGSSELARRQLVR